MGARVVTVNEVLDGHVALDIQCLDRIYLNAYVPKLQSSAQVVAFLSGIGLPVCVSCVVQPDRSAVPSGGGVFRRGQRHPVGEVRQG